MKKLTLALAIAAISANVYAHGSCNGQGACTTDNHSSTSNSSADGRADAKQDQWQMLDGVANPRVDSNVAVDGSNRSVSRYLNIRPVQPLTPPSISPSATVSRMVDPECGPRMRVVSKGVQAINNRMTETETFEMGYDQELMPANEPYRRVSLTNDIQQLIGHRLIETSAVVTVSTGHAWGFGANGNSGGGGSLGAGTSGSMQRLVTTIRLQECVAFEIDMRPVKKTKG